MIDHDEVEQPDKQPDDIAGEETVISSIDGTQSEVSEVNYLPYPGCAGSVHEMHAIICIHTELHAFALSKLLLSIQLLHVCYISLIHDENCKQCL